MSPLARGLRLGWTQVVATQPPIILRQVAAGISVRCMSGDSRLHSTDIAFKPAESGWGGGGKYANNFDAIFSKKKEDETSKKDEGKKDDEE